MRQIFSILLLATIWFAGTTSAHAQAAAEGGGFQDRQRNLVVMAETLGTMHHLRQICRPWDRPDLFRDRMKEMTTLEDPDPTTRSKMIQGFNRTYNAAKNRFQWCDQTAEDVMRRKAEEGQKLAQALGAPLGTPQGYDFYPGEETIDGVTVYRGGQ